MACVFSLNIGSTESLLVCIERVSYTDHAKIRDNHCNVITSGKIDPECKIILETCYASEIRSQFTTQIRFVMIQKLWQACQLSHFSPNQSTTLLYIILRYLLCSIKTSDQSELKLPNLKSTYYFSEKSSDHLRLGLSKL